MKKKKKIEAFCEHDLGIKASHQLECAGRQNEEIIRIIHWAMVR